MDNKSFSCSNCFTDNSEILKYMECCSNYICFNCLKYNNITLPFPVCIYCKKGLLKIVYRGASDRLLMKDK